MKRNILILMILLVAGVAYGQKKPKINKALQAAQEGRLQEAKDIIDAAIEHEKTKDKADTWYYRGLVYAAIDTTDAPEFQNLDPDPLYESVQAFEKAEELNTGSKELYITAANGLPVLKSQHEQMLWAYYLNQGVSEFQNANEIEAAKAFERCQVVKPQDTTCYIYAGLAYQGASEFDKAAENFNHLINNLDHHDKDIYNSLIYIEANIRKNDEKALELIRKARNRWPDNLDLSKAEINALIRLERIDEAMAELNAAIEAEPTNPDLYFSLGVMNEEIEKKEEAIEAYKKAVEVDPNYLNALYNLGVIYFNEAVELLKQKNSLGFSAADKKKEKELQKAANEKLNIALPYWEKVRELEPKNRTALEQLRYLYVQLKMNDKAENVQKSMEEYGYTDDNE